MCAQSSNGDSPAGESFRRVHRLRGARSYRQVFSRRASAGDKYCVVYVAPTDLPHARLGLTVSRRVGRAHRRNLWKRRLREVFRRELCGRFAGYDLVVIPRPAQKPPSYDTLRQSLPQVIRRAIKRLPRAPGSAQIHSGGCR